jgi:TRL-like protein family
MTIRTTLAAACTASFLALSGCYSAPIMPPVGLVFSSVHAPVQPAGEIGSLTGRASCHAILGVAAWGNCSLKAAATAAGITTVKHSDYTFRNIVLGAYQSYTTVVYGD